MARETVDFGIDLGTTNSAIAVAAGADARIVRNNLREEYTPSAVHIGRSGHLLVDRAARRRVESDPGNTHAEFKLQMGVRDAHRVFEGSGRTMTAEELSAEVLKSVRENVRAELGEEIGTAVITVPAAFELDQCDATRRAAELAGLTFAPLLQEPTAAAWAYSAVAADVPRRGFWLVYDFGGGTFDAAVIQVEDGEFTVVNHAGDNHLGGKLLDWTLVDDLLLPAARGVPGLAGLDRADPLQAGNVAKLKQAAEDAKIQVSQTGTAEVLVELTGAGREPVEFLHVVTGAEVDRLARPFYHRSIELCRTALADKGLAPGDIERVLLVGGTTLAPALRGMLADPREGLGVRLDHGLDPVTVVARGAAIFARTQRLPHDFGGRATSAERVLLDFAHRPTGRAGDPLVGGRARAESERDWTGHTIEFSTTARDALPWRSGRIPLGADGGFTTRLTAAPGENVYGIELRAPDGTSLPTEPGTTAYRRMAMEGGDATLSHSLGVWVEGREVAWILRKGAELPARGRLVLESTLDVRRGHPTGLIRVPLVQGERGRADRNTVIGQLDVRPEELSRDVPAGSEIEVVVEIDESFSPHVDAFIPILDEEFEIRVDLGRRTPDLGELRERGDAVTAQYRRLRRRAGDAHAERASELLDGFDRRGGLDGITRELESAGVNPDGPAICQELLREAESRLDDAEDALELPRLAQEAERARAWVREVLGEYGDPDDRRELREREKELEDAVSSGDPTLVTHGTEAVRAVGLRVLDSAGQLPVLRFGTLRDRFAGGSDPRAGRLLREGEAALAARDTNRLRTVVIELTRLVPADPGGSGGGLDTTVRQQR